MATAPKSNASAKAIWSAMKEAREGRTIPVPRDLRDAHYASAKTIGHGKNYVSPHDLADGSDSMNYLGVDRVFYSPTDHGFEAEIKKRLERYRRQLKIEESLESPSHENG